MININNRKPVVLVLAGHDPSGGAGIQADIESIASAGCHAATIITSLTTQNTNKVVEVLPQEPEPFKQQIQLILEDMDIAACKIGMIASAALIEIIHSVLSKKKIPLVLDPVISSASGKNFADKTICNQMLTTLIPLTTVLTPNSLEAKVLTQSDNLNTAAKRLLDAGTESVLITGTHEETDEVINSFYSAPDSVLNYRWERLPDSFHGSGCTLSSRIAANIALGNDLITAIENAQEYTWNSLKKGLKLGHGQAYPNRFFDN